MQAPGEILMSSLPDFQFSALLHRGYSCLRIRFHVCGLKGYFLTEKILGPLPSSSPPVPCPFLVTSAPT